ncbi:hypothetical protein V6L77_13405 [Pannonibacter sp. Pt2-lr]
MSALALAASMGSSLAQAANTSTTQFGADQMVWLAALGGACAFAVTASFAFLRNRRTSAARIGALSRENRDLKLSSTGSNPCSIPKSSGSSPGPGLANARA